MMTADEANKIANQITTVEGQAQLKAVDQLIWGAAYFGNFSADISQINLMPCVQELLVRDGYKLTRSKTSGALISVHWD